MNTAWKKSLRRYNPELRVGVIVSNFLPDLHCDAGGFLTEVEYATISSKRCNVSQMDELVTILLTKENADFDSFCRVLEKSEYRGWSEKLNHSESTQSVKQGPGGAGHAVPCPLIHSIKNDYLRVKDVFCNTPGMPSLDALKDRCCDLIDVAFADGPQIDRHVHEIQKAQTVRELARILFNRLSRWISFDFLENVIEYEHFQPALKDVKEQLAQYKEKLQPILMQKLKQIGELQQKEEGETSDGLKLSEIVVKYRLDADGLRVQDLITERDFLAQRLGIPEHLLQVLSWRPGSVIIVFLVVQELRPLIERALHRSDVRAELTTRSIETVHIDRCSSNLMNGTCEYQPSTHVSSQPNLGSGTHTAESSLEEENVRLRRKVMELTARCAEAEEGRRRAEEGWRLCDLHLAGAEAIKQQLEGENHQLASKVGEMKAKLLHKHGSEPDEKAKLKRANDKLKANMTRLKAEHAKNSEETEALRTERDCLRVLVSAPEVASLEVKDMLLCQDEAVQSRLRTLYDGLDTSPSHKAYTPGSTYSDWRCLADHVSLDIADLQSKKSKKRLKLIFEEWAKKEAVTVAKVHEVLIKSRCARAAQCLVLSAQCMMEQEQSEEFIDLEGEPAQSC